MQMDDLKKLATGNTLFNLHKIIAPRLVIILYFLGLAAIVLWAVAHFFATFRFGFGTGLWGLLEIAVFGLLSVVVLRIGCEAILVYFKSHADDAEDYAPVQSSGSLLDDVREAIEDLADEEETPRGQAPAPVAPNTPQATPGEPVAEEPATMPGADTPKPQSSAPDGSKEL